MFDESSLKKLNTSKTSQSKIDEFCNEIGVDLPKDYQQFLLNYNGVIFKKMPCFYIPDIKRAAELTTLYGFDFDNSMGTNLEKNYHYNFNYGLDGSTLVIGHCYSTQGNLCVMLINSDDTSGIYICDLFYDEFFFNESSESNNTFKIADSFSDFIKELEFPDDNNMVFFQKHNFSYKLLY